MQHHVNAFEVRVKRVGTEPPYIVGYAATFYKADDPRTQFQQYEDLVERILPGAFDRALREDDVRGLFNHEVGFVLGRVSSGTLKLSADSTGLHYEIKTPPTQQARDLLELIKRGD